MNESERSTRWMIEEMQSRGETLSVAESCTGGGLSRLVTRVSGASAAFVGGVVAYAPRLKTSLLCVDERLTGVEEIVSCATAQSMACGVSARLGSTWGVGTTGFAGPSGGSSRYGVGTVCVAVFSKKHGVFSSRALHVEGAREDVMTVGAVGALKMLLTEMSFAYEKVDRNVFKL